MDLTVIIVSYNVRHFLEQALLSVRKAVAELEAEIIVVDNDSVDDSVLMVRERFPEVQLIVNPDNTGFAVANNQAIRLAKGRYILLLNPDTVVEEDTFAKCIEFMDAHPDAGALGVRMIDGGGKYLPESKRGFPSPFVAFCKAFGLSRLFPKSATFNQYHLGHLGEMETAPVDVLAGAFMWLRKEAIDKAGLLDEAFFMYGEDIDLSFRIRQAGYLNYYFPEVTIIHYKGESTRKGSLNYIRIFYQAMILFAEKHFSGSRRSRYVMFIRLAIYLRAWMTLVRNIFKRSWLFLLDALLLWGGVILIKDFWAEFYFNDPSYYPAHFNSINAPLYALIWTSGLYLSGAYDRKDDLWAAARGLLLGSLLIAAVYGFLDQPYRTSRAVILMGTVWALLSALLVRMFAHYMKYGEWRAGVRKAANLVVVGSPTECERTMQLLSKLRISKNLIGFLSPVDEYDPHLYLNHIRRLDEVVSVFRVQEVIFCARDVRSDHMMQWMNLIGSAVEYRILPDGGVSIIGSASSIASGELYTTDVRFRLSDAVKRRHKRLLDVGIALILLVCSPVLIWFQSRKGRFLHNVIRLITGQRTLVSYGEAKDALPRLRPGLLQPSDAHPWLNLDQRTAQHLDFLYARDYGVEKDLRILMRNFKRLDR
ncbi:MAG: glycosyltransferase family 2 protein [Saprospiraceae bacterium]|nr:glycosyltransferase family 2 protein [Saprospiraceae bacterium]